MCSARADALRPERVITDDGSPTYLHPGHGASYRSTRGAATESRWVFLTGSGLLRKPGPWRVLELGFGSGLNFALTTEAALQAGVTLHYESMEPEPMAPEQWLVGEEWKSLQWGVPQRARSGEITLTVFRHRWQDHSGERGAVDALYHDPFGPLVAPDCWTESCFRWASGALSPTGVLATYGASSAARAAMKAAGLRVGSLPGAPGKREMTVAALSDAAIAHSRPWKR